MFFGIHNRSSTKHQSSVFDHGEVSPASDENTGTLVSMKDLVNVELTMSIKFNGVAVHLKIRSGRGKTKSNKAGAVPKDITTSAECLLTC